MAEISEELRLLVDENNRKISSMAQQGVAIGNVDNIRIVAYLSALLGERQPEVELEVQRGLREMLSQAEAQVARTKLLAR